MIRTSSTKSRVERAPETSGPLALPAGMAVLTQRSLPRAWAGGTCEAAGADCVLKVVPSEGPSVIEKQRPNI